MKRFYKDAAASAAADGNYTVLLDGKVVKTPKRAMLTLPNLALANAMAEEWRAQGEELKTESMPLTRLAFAAIDAVTPEREQIARQILKYAHSDLLSYRAENPPELVARQARIWDPLLDWAAETYGARLNVSSGIRHVRQPAEAIAALEEAIARYDEFELAALLTATTIIGSLIVALALAEEEATADEAFAAATLDETFQAEKWGVDAEAERRRQRLLSELTAAARFLRLLEEFGEVA
jgi:chaperone required for assembly of F1-ATPase